MGFGKAKYDVEEKGLDPKVAYKEVAQDGRLVAGQPSETAVKVLEAANSGLEKAVENLRALDVPVYGLDVTGEVVSEDRLPHYKEMPKEVAVELVTSMFEDESPEALAVEKARLAELDKVSLEEVEKNIISKMDSEESKQKYLETAEKLKDLEPADGVFVGTASVKPKTTKPVPVKKK
jgi:hypothetical protein